LGCALSIWFSGCAFITIPLITPELPLKEKVISGQGRAKILLLDISGLITTEEEKELGGLRYRPSLVARIKQQLQLAEKEEELCAIVLRINSPGGTVTASDIIYHLITDFKTRHQIPVIASLMELGTSGAYYIACSADQIIAHPTTVTGSIGVMVLKLNLAGLMDKLGVADETVKSGDKKDILFPLRPMTEEEAALVQGIIDDLFQRFREVVKKSRHLDGKALAEISDGRILTAESARRLGLVDRIGYLEDAISAAKAAAGIREAKVIIYARPYSSKGNIYSLTTPSLAAQSLLQQPLPALAHMLGPYFWYLWLP